MEGKEEYIFLKTENERLLDLVMRRYNKGF